MEGSLTCKVGEFLALAFGHLGLGLGIPERRREFVVYLFWRHALLLEARLDVPLHRFEAVLFSNG